MKTKNEAAVGYDFTKGASVLAHESIVKDTGIDTKKAKADAKAKEPKVRKPRKPAPKLEPVPEPEQVVKTPKAPKELRPVCDQKKKNGSACTGKAMQGATYCTDHRPPIDHLKADEIAKLQEYLGIDRSQLARVCVAFGWGKAQILARTLGKEGL